MAETFAQAVGTSSSWHVTVEDSRSGSYLPQEIRSSWNKGKLLRNDIVNMKRNNEVTMTSQRCYGTGFVWALGCAMWIQGTNRGSIFITLRAISFFHTLTQNGRHFAYDTFKGIFLNENVRISIEISLKFVPTGPINTIRALVQIMAWRRLGNKPLSEPMLTQFNDAFLLH